MKKLLYLLLLMAFISVTSCQKDEKLPFTDETESELTEDNQRFNTVYAHIKIVNSDITRADNVNDNTFEDGRENEKAVRNLLIVFYGEDQEVVGYYNNKSYTQNDDKNASDDIESKLEWQDAEVVPITMLRPGEPFYAIAFLNYDTSWEADLISKNVTDVLKVVKNTYTFTESVEGQNTQYFLMTNSGYFDGDDKYQIATKIKDFVYPTPEEAQNSEVITIYVERVAARVDFKIANDAPQKYTVRYGDDDYELTFVPLKWGLTATEKENYVLKNMQSTLSMYSNSDYAQGFKDWISYQRRRTYWAETPKYNSYTYPASGISATGKSLAYITDASTEFAPNGAFSTLYTFEHTFSAKDLTTASNAYAVPTSLLFTAQYSATKKEDNSIALNGVQNGFYIRTIANIKHIYLVDNGKSTNKNDLLVAYLKEQTVLWTKNEPTVDGEEPTYTRIGEEAYNDFDIVNTKTFYNKDDEWVESSNAYTLQAKATQSKDYYYSTYVKANGDTPAHYEYTKITSETLTNANKAIQQNVGSAFLYAGGRTFFYIPILHYITDNYKVTSDSDGEDSYNYTGDFVRDNEEKILNKTGEFGIVRNHIYRLTLNKIEGLGHGIPGENYPLIPNPDGENQWFFHAKLDVLSWHVVEFSFDLK